MFQVLRFHTNKDKVRDLSRTIFRTVYLMPAVTHSYISSHVTFSKLILLRNAGEQKALTV